MTTVLPPPYGFDDEVRIARALHDLVGNRAGATVSSDPDKILRQIGMLGKNYIGDRLWECDRLLEIAREPLRACIERRLRAAWEISGDNSGRPFVMALERAIVQLREDTRDNTVQADFRRDLRSLSANRRLRLGRALTRPYAEELVSALHLGAIEVGLDVAEAVDVVNCLNADRDILRKAAAAALDHPMLELTRGPAGDDAAIRYVQAMMRLVRLAGGRTINAAIRIDSTHHKPHHGLGFNLLAACLQPLKPSLTESGAVGLVRAVRDIKRHQAKLHDNS